MAEIITRAAIVAARWHTNQRRKGAEAEPYVNHLAEVAHLIAAAEPDNIDLICAAYLHDAIEDQKKTREEIERLFNSNVADIVVEVTDDKTIAKDERKRLQVVNTPEKSRDAKLLKLADKTSNLRALVDSPPADWSIERRRGYIDWACAVVNPACLGISEYLDEQFQDARIEAYESLDGAESSLTALPPDYRAAPVWAFRRNGADGDRALLKAGLDQKQEDADTFRTHAVRGATGIGQGALFSGAATKEQLTDDGNVEMIYWRGIFDFSFRRFEEIARQIIYRLKRLEATGAFGDDYEHKTLWDEYCHEKQEGPSVFRWAIDETVRPIVDGLIEALPKDEVALLSLSNDNYDGCGSDQPVIDMIFVADEILECLAEAADTRDMSRFDPSL